MKTIGSWMFAGLLALPLLASAQVNSLPSQPHLLVKGEAEQKVVPDRFSLSVTLRAVDTQPDKARARVQLHADAVLNAFKSNHIVAESIEASSLSIGPSRRFEPQGGRDVFEGTEVKRTLAAAFPTLADARGFLAALQTSDEVELSGIVPSYSRSDAVRAELKRQAAEQTKASADALAKAYGVRIGGLYTISDVAPSFAYGVQAGTWPGSRTLLPPRVPAPLQDMAAVAESLEAGSITLTENVYAVFLIAQ